MRICAWCKSEMPSKGEGADLITHGICDKCANTMMSEMPIPLQSHLDSLHVPILAVDAGGVVFQANTEALRLVGKSQEDISQCLGGDVFSCIHAKTPEGCGRTIHCSGCVIRNCVTRTYETGEPQVMVPATLKQGDPDNFSAVSLTITTVKQGGLVLLMVHAVE
jgi:PAS domain-containing protein